MGHGVGSPEVFFGRDGMDTDLCTLTVFLLCAHSASNCITRQSDLVIYFMIIKLILRINRLLPAHALCLVCPLISPCHDHLYRWHLHLHPLVAWNLEGLLQDTERVSARHHEVCLLAFAKHLEHFEAVQAGPQAVVLLQCHCHWRAQHELEVLMTPPELVAAVRPAALQPASLRFGAAVQTTAASQCVSLQRASLLFCQDCWPVCFQEAPWSGRQWPAAA